MGRAPCCAKEGLRRGAWSAEEDARLVSHIRQNGHPNWRALPRQAGLLRCGKSCRLRWINYLRPDIKRGNFSADEEALIVRLHRELGNRWSAIAAQLPGRTDNEIKNVWHTHIKKRLDDHDEPGSGSGDASVNGGRQEKKKKARTTAVKKPAISDVDSSEKQEQPFLTASPGLSSNSGVTFSATTTAAATDSAAAVSSKAENAATTSSQEQEQKQEKQVGSSKTEKEMESFVSSAAELLPDIDDSFWSSADVVVDMGLGAMDEELGLALAGPPSLATGDEDMEFWLKMLLEAGDMRDLSVL